MRSWLRTRLDGGFWFPAVQMSICFLYKWICLGSHFNRWLKNEDEEKAPAGASELVVFVSLTVSLIWLSLINLEVPWLSSPAFRTLGAILALWRVSEIGLVAAYTVFVFSGRIYATRRSLACCLVNLIELGVYSAIFIILAGCAPAEQGRWDLAYAALADVFSLRPTTVLGGSLCQGYGHYQLILGALVLGVMIANLVGRITHDEVSITGETETPRALPNKAMKPPDDS